MRLCSSANGICSEANQGEVLLPGDVLIICSDGLTDLVSDDEILAAVRQFPAERALEELVKSANQRGGHDNITILYLGMPATKEEAAEAVQPRSRLRILPACLAAAAVVGLCAFLAAGLLWYRLRSEARLNLPNLAIPRIQVTLFPGTAENELPLAATPSVLPALTGTLAPPAETPEAPENPAPADLPAATLTPWPTNTPGPAP
jgi:hypothetical protein